MRMYLLATILIAAAVHAGTTGHPPTSCPGLRNRLDAMFERGASVWNPDPWAYAEPDTANWQTGSAISRRRAVALLAPIATDSKPNWGEAEDCSLIVYRRFYVDDDTIAATIGRAPEACSEAPRLLWHRNDETRRRSLPPLFNWNIESLWCTSRYVVFGLSANYEGGPWDERLAFWNASTGTITLAPGRVWKSEGETVEPAVYLPRTLPGWRQASVAEAGDALVFVHGDTTIAYWPERRRAWASR